MNASNQRLPSAIDPTRTATLELNERELAHLYQGLESEIERCFAAYGKRVIDPEQYGRADTALCRLHFLEGLRDKINSAYEQTRGVK